MSSTYSDRAEASPTDRRSFLRWVYAATAGGILVACGDGDADMFSSVDGTGTAGSIGDGLAAGEARSSAQTLRVQTDQAAAAPDASTSQSVAESASTTEPPSTTDTAAPSSSESPTTVANGGALPGGAAMVVSFTYLQLPGGKDVSPYIAVWVENAAGDLHQTVALWYQQFGRGERWLPDLTRWYNVDQDRIVAGGTDTVAAISGPTRDPGSFQVVWDGRADGVPSAPGEYFLCIEAARERGPYSLIREPVMLDGRSIDMAMVDDAELVEASVTVG